MPRWAPQRQRLPLMPSRIGRWPRRQALGMGSGSPREWVFVQKCLLEPKRSYLTEKGLFSRKALFVAQHVASPRLLETSCSTIEQMRLGNELCWAKNFADRSR